MKIVKNVALVVIGAGLTLASLSGCSVSVDGNDYKAVKPFLISSNFLRAM